MSERIYKALSEHYIRLMRNWARASSGCVGVVGSGLVSSCYNLVTVRSGYHAAPVPTLMGEADDVERALNAVPIRYRQAVQIFWWWEGASLRALARRLGGVDHHTAQIWVLHGHDLLRQQLRAQRRAVSTIATENQKAALPSEVQD